MRKFNRIIDGPNNQLIEPTDGDDFILALGGEDSIPLSSGFDIIVAGKGSDWILFDSYSMDPDSVTIVLDFEPSEDYLAIWEPHFPIVDYGNHIRYDSYSGASLILVGVGELWY